MTLGHPQPRGLVGLSRYCQGHPRGREVIHASCFTLWATSERDVKLFTLHASRFALGRSAPGGAPSLSGFGCFRLSVGCFGRPWPLGWLSVARPLGCPFPVWFWLFSVVCRLFWSSLAPGLALGRSAPGAPLPCLVLVVFGCPSVVLVAPGPWAGSRSLGPWGCPFLVWF